MSDIFADYPPLHNREFGGSYGGKEWVGRFTFWKGQMYPWEFAFIDENAQPVPYLTCRAETPRAALEEVVARYIGINNGKLSETLKVLLPRMMEYFNEDGNAKAEHILDL